MACILPWSCAVRVHDSQAYRKMDMTRERISCILELREILLSIQTGFSLGWTGMSQVFKKNLCTHCGLNTKEHAPWYQSRRLQQASGWCWHLFLMTFSTSYHHSWSCSPHLPPRLFLNHEGCWGTTDDFTTSFLHFSLFSTDLLDLTNCCPFPDVVFPPLPRLSPWNNNMFSIWYKINMAL